jgi:hypothetical protein
MCHLKNSVQPVKNTGDNSIVSGTVNHGEMKCNGITSSNSAEVPTLESIFTHDQPSFAYKTCFETFDSGPSRNILYVFVFPNGIHMSAANYQQLLLQLNGSLLPYTIPAILRNNKSTLQSYTLTNANKNPTQISQNGDIYATSLSSCSDDFKNRFEFFTLSPKSTKTTEKFVNYSNHTLEGFENKCIPTRQYKCESRKLKDLQNITATVNGIPSAVSYKNHKCMTFDTQSVNDGTNTYLVPDKKMIELNDILSTAAEIEKKENSIFDNLTTDEKEKYIAIGIGSGLIIVSVAFLVIKKYW